MRVERHRGGTEGMALVGKSPRGASVAPPDGDWGWMIVAGCFLATICTRAVTRCVSIFFVEFQVHFGQDYSGTAWIHSLADCTTFLFAPLGSFIGNHLSTRATVIIGGVLSSTGLILSSFATSLEYLYLTLGVLTGLGFALSYTPAVAMVGSYFNERKALAYGIAMSGSGIGTFILAPAVQLLIEHYSWRGALLILGGFVSNLCVCGALMRPLVPKRGSQKLHKLESGYAMKPLDAKLAELQLINGKVMDATLPGLRSLDPKTDLTLKTTKLTETKKTEVKLAEALLANVQLADSRLADMTIVEGMVVNVNNMLTETILEEITLTDQTLANRKLKEIKLLENLVIHSQLADVKTLDTKVADAKLADKKLTDAKILSGRVTPEPIGSLAMEFRFLLMPDFMLLSVSFLFLAYGCSVPFVYLVPYALSVGVDHQQAAFVMSILGVTGIVGNITFGWLTDRKCLKEYRKVSFMFAVGMEGLSCLLIPMLHSFALLVPFSMLYGYFDGAYSALIPVVTSDLVGSSYLSSALGVVNFLHAIPYLVSPPVGGWLVDWTGDYTAAFFLSGFSLMSSPFILATGLLIRRCCRTRAYATSAVNAKCASLNNGQMDPPTYKAAHDEPKPAGSVPAC
ncbi:monocarboxylate transporter 12-B [Esox lucius]|uniref:Major facilitator superfamily (MFS) profile domain-containing protein n=1 Tax=Esox lucius TaxID=8010 RepID=A0A3P8XGM3_ESOLU|nr:monocarboxylate transporter 12-B [Esox lucius]XP_019902669.2 monocarboxylate transporter 12-B [Esox lucius]XP_019902670.2 monocarboxylate transporter 12-B [Esox lucius]